MANTNNDSSGGSNTFMLVVAAAIIGLLALVLFVYFNNPRSERISEQESQSSIGIEAPESGQQQE